MKISEDKAEESCCRPNDVRRHGHSFQDLKELEHWKSAERMIHSALAEATAKHASGRSSGSMVLDR